MEQHSELQKEHQTEQQDHRFVTVAVVDTNGILRGQKLSAKNFASTLKSGRGMSPVQLALEPTDVILPIEGISNKGAHYHDVTIEVDKSSRRRLPFEVEKDSEIYLAQFTGDVKKLCPRSMLKEQLARCENLGFKPKIGFEQEFTLLNETSSSLREKQFDNLETATPYSNHDLFMYQSLQSDFYAGVADMCDTMGVELAKMHGEISPGFMECCIEAGIGITPVDQLIMLRNLLKVFAMRRGQTITYMSRWSEKADSQSCHIHLSLLDENDKSVFFDSDVSNNMSYTFRYFLGGLQQYLPGMMPIFAPTVNSWRRFAKGTFAPPGFNWGIENRTAGFRVVGNSENSLRFENRLPCADANPYLTLSAMLAAGLSGIEEKIEPSEETTGDGFQHDPQKGASLPKDMKTAIEQMAASNHARACLGDRFVDAFVSTRTAQLESFKHKTIIDERKRFLELG